VCGDRVIDSHCHLAGAEFVHDLAEVLARAETAGLSAALCILSADEPEELARARTLGGLWPALRFAVGVHPHRAGAFAGRAGAAADASRAAARTTGAVAIGEIGLDYHYDVAPRDVQRAVFASQVSLAIELERPVVIHTREAAADTFEVLEDAGQGLVRGVMHCFTGTEAEAARALALGLHLSFAGILTFPKAGALRDVARGVPDDRVLVETDAPFLAPVPHRGRRNEPAWVVATVSALAAIRGVPVEAMAAAVTRNFDSLFGVR